MDNPRNEYRHNRNNGTKEEIYWMPSEEEKE